MNTSAVQNFKFSICTTNMHEAISIDNSNILFSNVFDDNILQENKKIYDEKGKYSIFFIADWFLSKEEMSHKKLQKLCYYAQAWNYALNDFRLENTDYEAWIHGPVSPALWEKFKGFGYSAIRIIKKNNDKIEEKDIVLLNNVWETYGDKTGNELEILSHRELPWIEARKGYGINEKCNVVISPLIMKKYYKSIYCENK